MLLMKLEAREKFAFLQLSHYLARIDGVFGQKEEEIIEGYCLAMGIENSTSFDESTFSLDETLRQFSSVKSKRIVVLALMVLIHIDDHFDTKEHELVSDIMEKFKLDMKKLKSYSSWAKAFSAMHEQARSFVDED